MKAKFKPGDVVENVNNGERLVVIDHGDTTYHVAGIDNNFDEYLLDYELSSTRVKPYAVAKTDRKDEAGNSQHTFVMFGKGRKRLLSAGCRWFTNLDDAKAHWSGDDGTYYGNEDLTPHRIYDNKNSLKIISRLNKRVTAKLEG